jgi:hypothetical protein
MLYRRNPFNIRRFTYPHQNFNKQTELDYNLFVEPKELDEIPPPKEERDFEYEIESKRKKNVPFFLSNFISRIPFEEIILIVLIIVALDGSPEDDFLSIILIYLLLCGNR